MAEDQSLFRSVEMSYIQVLVPAVVAEEFVDAVARDGNVEFTDLNEDVQPFARKYTPDILKIQDTERQIHQIEEYLTEYDLSAEDAEIDGDDVANANRQADPQLVTNITENVNEAFIQIRDQVSAERQLSREFTQYNDAIRVLQQLDELLNNDMMHDQKESLEEMKDQRPSERTPPPPRSSNAVPLLTSASDREVGFQYFAGVVSNTQRFSFERQVFLTSRGNSFVQFQEDDDERYPFVVIFLGQQLKRSLTRLCQFMNIQIAYESDSDQSPDDLLKEAQTRANDLARILNATKAQLMQNMRRVRADLKGWKISLRQEKAIRVALNRFREHQGNVLRAEGWCPSYSVDKIQNQLDNVTRGKGVGRAVLTVEDPRGQHPTYFVTNEFTSTFQEVVDTYGVPRYQEFNPAVPTIITFPFLFGVMYGDIFHGSCLLLFTLILFLLGNRIRADKKHSLASAYPNRFLLLFMGMFAVYCGIIYNDCMSLSPNSFNGKQWGLYTNGDEIFVGKKNGVYGIGIDPAWHGVSNNLKYANSLKMKLSVTLGVTQMTFGLFCKMANHIHEQDYVSLIWEFIPQFIFMMVFFGWMIFMIFLKWTVNYSNPAKEVPQLIQTLIQMVLGVGKLGELPPVLETKSAQVSLQQVFVVLMVLMIPLMLLPKPFILRHYHNQEVANQRYGRLGHEPYEQVADEDPDAAPHGGGGGGHGGHGHGEEFVFSEVMIHQMIHTIEYVLGTISNTASYLRLWALSLAHAQLSEVFFDMFIKQRIENVLFLVVGTMTFFLVTFAVLLVMDVLECFLHALRLHWVEFQNKFYYADGVAFVPFAYKTFEKEE